MKELIFEGLPPEADVSVKLKIALKRSKQLFKAARVMTNEAIGQLAKEEASIHPGAEHPEIIAVEDAAILYMALVADAYYRHEHPGEDVGPLAWTSALKRSEKSKDLESLTQDSEINEGIFFDMMLCRVDANGRPLEKNTEGDLLYPAFVAAGKIGLDLSLIGVQVTDSELSALTHN